MKEKVSFESVARVVQDEIRHLDYILRGPDFSIGEWLLIMESGIQGAKEAWNNHLGEVGVLDEVRVAAAAAVGCMLQHGAPGRKRDG